MVAAVNLPEIRTGEPWVWPDGTPVRMAGPCAAVEARQTHGAHPWQPEAMAGVLGPVECSGYPVPPTYAEQETQRAWDRHCASALKVAR